MKLHGKWYKQQNQWTKIRAGINEDMYKMTNEYDLLHEPKSGNLCDFEFGKYHIIRMRLSCGNIGRSSPTTNGVTVYDGDKSFKWKYLLPKTTKITTITSDNNNHKQAIIITEK